MHRLSFVLTRVKSLKGASIEFGLNRSVLVIAVLGLLPRPALVGAVLVEAVADPLPDVDEVLGGDAPVIRGSNIYTEVHVDT